MKKLVGHIHDKGRYCGLHSCGHVEDRVPVFIDAGLDTWQMQANCNDVNKVYENYGDKIEILPGAGLRKGNAIDFLAAAGTTQLHSSCKGYHTDPTAKGKQVTYAYNTGEHEMDVEIVSLDEVVALRSLI